jgi:hypothetical protein
MGGIDERRDRPAFGRGVVVAALAAIALPGCVLLAAPVLGFWLAVTTCLTAIAILYAAWLAPDRRTRALTLVFAGISGAALLALTGGGSAGAARDVAIGAALIIAVSRSLLQYRARPLRTAFLELALSGGGLLLAALLAGHSLLSLAAALWGYLLVQSFFLLAPGILPGRGERVPGDPFDLASARLERLFEEG